MKEHVTIKDIARLCGVSVSTVSRVINHSPDVNEATRARVMQAIERMNYSPNPAAKALISKKSRLLGVIVPNLNHSVISRTVKGITQEAQKAGFDVLLFDYDNDPRIEVRQLELLGEKVLDGVISITSIAPAGLLLDLQQKLPLVLLERTLDGMELGTVQTDDDFGMKLLVSHLVELGHHTIGMLTGEVGTYSADRRTHYFLEHVSRFLPDFPVQDYLMDCAWSMQGGFVGLHELIRMRPDVTAVVCANDQIALGALGCAHQLGFSVPQELSIVGFDNFDESQYSVPPLTTLSFPAQRVGETAVKFLIERILNPNCPRHSRVLPLTLLQRKSTAPPRQESLLQL